MFSPPPLSLQCPTALLDPCSCTFYNHVLCSNGRITSLNLHNQSLSGPFPTSLLNLTGLTGLSLYGNKLSGTVPTSLGKLTGLTDLGLYGNQLSGTVPTQLAQLTGLTFLSPNNNPALSGKLPALNFAQYTRCCALGGDNFSCPLPPGAASCRGGTLCGTKPSPTCR
jgi:Leucine-rich repeat (LRR) protein